MKQTEFFDGKIKLWMDDNHRYWIQEDITLDLEILAEINKYRRKIFNPVEDVFSIENLEITDRPPLQVPALTAVLGMISKSGAITQWAANLAADHFRDNLNHNSRLTPNDIDRLHREARFAHKQKSKEATDIGTAVHAFAEGYIRHQLFGEDYPDMPMDDQTLNGIMAFLSWIKEHGVVFHKSEFQLYSFNFNLAGTCDVLYESDGKMWIGDFKTSKDFFPEHEYQVSFYRYAYQSLFHDVDSMSILRFDKLTGLFFQRKIPEDNYARNLSVVKSARDLHYAINGF